MASSESATAHRILTSAAATQAAAQRLPAPVLSRVAVNASLINVELLLVQHRIALHDDGLACELFHLLQPPGAVRF